jgi:itaconate CoA-transferase
MPQGLEQTRGNGFADFHPTPNLQEPKMNNSQVKPRPLDGITVVSLEHAIAAPFCTRQLADLGARVIKVERPGAGDFARGYDERVDGLASHFVWTNRSKESLTLDVKQDAATQVLDQLLAKADVLVQNLAPGAAARMGLSFEALHERFPRLIVCDISGYGEGGPYEQKKAYDLLIQSEGGFLSVTGGPGETEMAKAGCSIADIAAGMYAYTGVLSALMLRDKTGVGSRIDVSMLESLVEWMGYPLYYAYKGATPPPRAGAAHATIYPYGPFPTGDGGTVMLGLQNEREWLLFCEKVLLQPALASDARFSSNSLRSEHRAELRALIVEAFSRLSADEVIARLDAAPIANAHVNDMAGVWAHPQLQARQRWSEVDSPSGKLPALLPPGRNEAFTPRMDPIPALGQHTDALLSELGYAPGDIQRLHEQGAVLPRQGASHESIHHPQCAVRSGNPPGAHPQGAGERRRRGHRRPRGRRCGKSQGRSAQQSRKLPCRHSRRPRAGAHQRADASRAGRRPGALRPPSRRRRRVAAESGKRGTGGAGSRLRQAGVADH